MIVNANTEIFNVPEFDKHKSWYKIDIDKTFRTKDPLNTNKSVKEIKMGWKRKKVEKISPIQNNVQKPESLIYPHEVTVNLAIFVIGGLNWISFSNGFVFGHVASLISALHKKEDGIDFTKGQISLIASTLSITCIIGFGIVAAVTDKIGRRWPFILFSLTTSVNWIILYFAKEMYQFLLSKVIGGISVGALLSLNIFVTSEYTSPKTRPFFLNMVTTVSPAIGTALAHAFGIVLQWRNVSLIGLFISALGIALPYFWVESPHWLAYKGKFAKCETAFRILHKTTPNSERELQLLTRMETSKLRSARESNRKPTLKRLFDAFKRKYFWTLLILSIVMHIYYAAAGKLVFSILATVILEEITGTSDVLLFTLLVDSFIILGSFISCVLIRRTSMRVLLFSTGFTANGLLVVFAVCYYMKDNNNYFNWINVSLLALYFIIVHAGPYSVLEALFSEMFPLELKVYMFFISGIVLTVALSLTIILLPYTVSAMGYHGLFVMNASIMTISLCYIWLMLPETKGRTLQEIEMYFKTNNFDVNEELSKEQGTAIV